MEMKMMSVKWRDTMSLDGWRTKETVDEWLGNEGYNVMISVGFVYETNSKSIVLVRTIHEDDEGSALAAPLSIPVTAIICTKELE